MKRINAVIFMLAVLLPVQQSAAESVRRSGGDNVNSALLQQITAERDELRAKQEQLTADNERQAKELAGDKSKLSEMTKEISRLKAQIGETSRDADRAQESGAAVTEKLVETQERLQKVVEKYKELVSDLRSSEERSTVLETSVAEKSDVINQCINDNQTLYLATQELLQHYEQKGVWDAFLQHEPVTQIKRVEIETIGESYRDMAEQGKFELKSSVTNQ